MDFSPLMSACEEQWGPLDDAHRLARVPHPVDRRLAELPDRVAGYATENKVMLLNLAVRHLEAGEVYVEVGTWQGLSLIGASMDTPGGLRPAGARLRPGRDRFGRYREPTHPGLSAT
jgi:hypothetical protein